MKRIALADCNNFFVSCERVFDPKLIGKPVVVLSSNDACVIARSNEAKKLGIKMGEPAYMCKEIFKKYNVKVLSANFSLYGDMSSRVMQTLTEYSSDIEIYSIHEAFMHFPTQFFEFQSDQEESACYVKYAHFVRDKVKQKIGMPVSIGLGPTKTLAKIANHIAKKNPEYNGVFDITKHPNIDNILKNFDVSDIWGIGYRYTKLLHKNNIKNAYDLKNCQDNWVKKNLTINGLKTVWELRGITCLNIEEIIDPKKSITVSRSFGRNVTDLNELKQALAYHSSTAAEKLRKQKMIAGVITVFICFIGYDYQRYYKSHTFKFPITTSYTPDIIKFANICLQKLFKQGQVYKKIGVIVDNLYHQDSLQLSTILNIPDLDKQSDLMCAVDKINSKMGRNKIFFAAVGVKHDWQTKKDFKTPAYTTNWHELLIIKI